MNKNLGNLLRIEPWLQKDYWSLKFIFLICLMQLAAPKDAIAWQPPEEFCAPPVSGYGGCGPTLKSAIDKLCAQWIAGGFNRHNDGIHLPQANYQTAPTTYPGFAGSTPVYGMCFSAFYTINPSSGIGGVRNDDNSIYVVPVCPIVNGERPQAGGSDVATACPGGTVDVHRGPTLTSETSGTELSCKAESFKNPASGKPIYPLSGKKTKTIDLGFRVGEVDLTLTYESARQITAIATGKSAKEFGDLPSFGPLWFSNLHRKLLLGSGSADLKVLRGNGTHSGFWNNGPGIVTSASNPDTLTHLSGGARYWNAKTGTLEIYNSEGQITGLFSTGGSNLKFFYSAGPSATAPSAGYLIKVVDNQGRSVRYEYSLPAGAVAELDGVITRMVGPDGSVLQFAYDNSSNLVRITWPDGRARQLLYEHPSHQWALTGELDENGARYSTYTYDSSGRAIATELANGVNRYAITYDLPPSLFTSISYDSSSKITYRYLDSQPPLNAVLSDPSGQAVSLTSASVNGRAVLIGKSQAAGSGCAASSTAAAFDANGNLTTLDDYAGKRTCLAYDSSNREVARVEGLSNTVACSTVLPAGSSIPAGARKITMTWHPDWRVPVQVTQPLLSITTVYQGQPDPFNGNAAASCSAAPNLPNGKPAPLVCKKVERALLASGSVDSSVPIKSSSYTYDVAGRVLTETDSKGQTTSYNYYAGTIFNGEPVAGAIDPDFDLVTLLVRGNGINGSTAVEDGSIYRRPVSVWDGAKISTAQSKFDGTSIAFDGSRDYVSIPYEPRFAFGSEDFTIETFLYKNANNPNGTRISHVNGDYYDAVGMYIHPNGDLGVYLSTSGTAANYFLPAVTNLANGQWYHLAVSRSEGSVYAFVNGVRYTVTTALGATRLYESGRPRVIGGQIGENRSLNGYIDEFRITKGKARYTVDFTPPTEPHPSTGPIPSPADVGHTIGDLQSITNPAGHVTQFTQYDRAGRVRQMIDPKGVVTDISYTPRGWVNTVAITAPGASARTTTYTYDGVGQVTGVAQPDGSSLSYSYDAAHRLIGVTDAKGNSVAYTLDNSGNRIAEEIKDPTGVLQRSIGRSFDALNRVQQVTGAAQ